MDPRRALLGLVALACCTDAADAPPAPQLPALTADPAEPRACVGAPPAAGAARASHVVCAEQLARGPLAMGRVGDVLVENAVARFILRSGDESATTIGAPGGGVIDATASRDAPDFVKEVLPTLNLYGLAVGALIVVKASGAEAVVRAAFTPRPLDLIQSVLPLPSQRPAVRGVVEYALRADEPVLRVRVCALPSGDAGTLTARPGLVAILGGRAEALAVGGAGVLQGDMAFATSRTLLAESPETGFGAALDDAASVLHAGTVTLLDGTARTTFAADAVRCVEMRVAVARTAAGAFEALRAGANGAVIDTPVPADGRAELRDAAGNVLLRSRGEAGVVRVHAAVDPSRTRVAQEGGDFGPPGALPATGVLRVDAQVRGVAGAPVRIAVTRGEDFDARFVVTESTRRTLPAGTYRVSASRGMEHTAVSADVTIAAGAEAAFDAVLERVVDTSGYVSTDFHLHTELSTDSVHPVADAARQVAGEGIEVVASTDHDFITDIEAVVGEAGMAPWLLAVPGEEVSTVRLGHYGGYPLRRDAARAGAGAVPWFGLSPAQIARQLRARGDDVLVQVNHPRLRGSGVFDQIGLDAATGEARGDPTAVGLPEGTDLTELAFDVVEVWNGYTRGGNERTFTDWLSLRAAGRRFVMVGNSDSHRPDKAPGAPRSFVRVPDDGAGRARWADVLAGLRGGDVSVGAGLFVEASVEGVRPGGRATARDGRVMLRVRVQGPPWADCTRVRVYRGAEVVVDRRVMTPADRAVRFDEVIAVEVPRASFLVVRADGEREAAPVFDFPPFGVTNPIDVGAM